MAKRTIDELLAAMDSVLILKAAAVQQAALFDTIVLEIDLIKTRLAAIEAQIKK